MKALTKEDIARLMKYLGEAGDRPFTGWPDLGALVEKLTEDGEVLAFYEWAYAWAERGDPWVYPALFASIIMNPARCSWLVSEWLREKA